MAWDLGLWGFRVWVLFTCLSCQREWPDMVKKGVLTIRIEFRDWGSGSRGFGQLE